MTDLDVTGRECLSFTIRGDWGHFRRIDTTNDKQTYHVIPRTTVAGLIAAVMGLPRDSYYDIFARDSSAIAIEPLAPIRTMYVPMLTVPTTEGDIGTAEGTSGKTVVTPKAMEEQRQRRSFEYLRAPAYRIHVVLDDTETHKKLADRLDVDSQNPVIQPVYTPALGKTECLAELSDPTRSEVTNAGSVNEVDSIVPEDILAPTAEVSYSFERTPAYMAATNRGRKTTDFVSYAYPSDGGTVSVTGVPASEVDGSSVVFI